MLFPSLHGNWFDLVIILFLVFYIWEGWGRGFIRLFFELLAFVSGFLLALKIYPFAAKFLIDNFSFSTGIARAAGFFTTGLIIEQILSYIFSLIESKFPEKWQRSRLNYYLSIFPLLGNGLVLLAFILTLLLALPVQGWIKSAVSQSKFSNTVMLRTQTLEKQLAGIFNDAVSDTLNFITVTPSSHEQVKLHFTQTQTSIDVKSEMEMFEDVNKERLERGLRGLVFNEKLRDLARVYGQDMFNNGYFSHYDLKGRSPFDRMNDAGIHFTAAGENLAFAPTEKIAHQGLMDSPGHRANILSQDYGQVGIGVVDGGIYGKMFVQEFTK